MSFEQAWAAVASVQGWLSEGQARMLWDHARALPSPSTVVEIGSYQGRSAVVLALAAPPGSEVVAVDPHAGTDRGPNEIAGYAAEGRADHDVMLAHLERVGVIGKVRHLDLMSHDAHDAVEGPVDLLYVDGAHRYRPARDDIRQWGARVRPGGVMLVHDSWSAVGVTLAQLRLLVFGRRFRYLGRSRTMTAYRRQDLRGAAWAGNVARQFAELPFALRTQLVKVALVLRLRPLAHLLGHPRGDAWPY